MKKYLFFILVFICIVSDAQTIPKNFYKRFEGTIDGKYNITVNLIRTDSVLSGNYYYNDKGYPIDFVRSSIDSAFNFYLEEDAGYDEKYNPVTTGIFKGKFSSADKIEGFWEKPGSGKQLVFSCEEKYPDGSAEFEVDHTQKDYNTWGSASIEVSSLNMINFKNTGIQKKINDSLNNALLGHTITLNDSMGYKSIDEMMNEFINSYKDVVVRDSAQYADYRPQYEYITRTEVLFNSQSIVSLQKIDYSFLGGAHPSIYIEYLNFDLAAGKEITLDDLFKPGYMVKLNKTGEKKFRDNYNLTASASLDSAGFFFEDGFKLNDNFSITKAGIKFLFNQYEAGPYVLGAPEVYIPFSEIRDLIKENSIIAK